jgi:hypothetical protein
MRVVPFNALEIMRFPEQETKLSIHRDHLILYHPWDACDDDDVSETSNLYLHCDHLNRFPSCPCDCACRACGDDDASEKANPNVHCEHSNCSLS